MANKLLLLTLLILSNITLGYSQVTIGSSGAPEAGALLQLKENDNTGVNSTKGLNLPRVALKTKLNDLNITLGIDDVLDAKEHTGLIVYSTTICLDGVYGANGVYVWDGSQWNKVNNTTTNTLSSTLKISTRVGSNTILPNAGNTGTVTGKSGTIYKTSDFGSAGIWMIEDLKETEYEDSQTQNTILVRTGKSGNIGKDAIAENQPTYRAYYFPTDKDYSTTEDNITEDRKWYDNNKDSGIGLLYTWGAATNGEYTEIFKGNRNIPNYSNERSTVQGICPDGWVIPSDWDFALLEQEMIINYKKYSNGITTAPEPWTLNWMDGTEILSGTTLIIAHASRGTHASVMKTACFTPGFYGTPTTGYSNSIGYNAMLNGYRTYAGVMTIPGKNEHHWSSSRVNYISGTASSPGPEIANNGSLYNAYYRYFNSGNTIDVGLTDAGVGRFPNLLNYMFNVRCKLAN